MSKPSIAPVAISCTVVIVLFLLGVAISAGGIRTTVKTNESRIEKLEAHHDEVIGLLGDIKDMVKEN